MMRTLLSGAAGVTILAAAGCDVDPVGPFPVTRIEIESGDAQVAEAGTMLPEPIVAQPYLEDGTEAIYLLWLEFPDGGSFDLGGARGSGPGVRVKAPRPGTVSVEWTLPDEPGEHRIRFFAVRLDGDTVEAVATATATAPAG